MGLLFTGLLTGINNYPATSTSLVGSLIGFVVYYLLKGINNYPATTTPLAGSLIGFVVGYPTLDGINSTGAIISKPITFLCTRRALR